MNHLAHVHVKVGYVDAAAVAAALALDAIVCPYMAHLTGSLDLPSNAGGTVAVPFGNIGSLTTLLVRNLSDVEVGVSILEAGLFAAVGGAGWATQWPQFNIAPGGMVLVSSPTKVTKPPTHIQCVSAVGAKPGSTISFYLFGDPVDA